jgi:hypothetical protein
MDKISTIDNLHFCIIYPIPFLLQQIGKDGQKLHLPQFEAVSLAVKKALARRGEVGQRMLLTVCIVFEEMQSEVTLVLCRIIDVPVGNELLPVCWYMYM